VPRSLQGILIPTYPYHQTYWLGLKAVPKYPTFIWLDPNVALPGPTGAGANGWGTNPAGELEPVKTTACGQGRYDELLASPAVYGWASESCTATMPYICRMFGGCTRSHADGCSK
jgi:hypothetical protein